MSMSIASRQRSMIAGYFASSTTRRRQTRRIREMQPSPRYMPSRYEYGAAGNAAKLWATPHAAEPAGTLDRTCGRQRQSRTVGRGMPVSRAMAQSFMPAAMSCRTALNSSADRIVAPSAGCLQRRKRHRQLDGRAGTIVTYARVSELADEMALGAIVLWAWGFESPLAHSFCSDLRLAVGPGLACSSWLAMRIRTSSRP